MGWDLHLAIKQNLPVRCGEIDQPAAALVMDLKQRGLLDDTLVMFGSEFGRTPFAQGQLDNPLVGRDHHGGNFTWWIAGGGVKAGYSHGETDDFSYNIVKDPVHIHDFNATLLHLLGLDHERLTFRSQGRDFRLTDVHGKVVHADSGVAAASWRCRDVRSSSSGRFHVLALHLPIGIVVAAVVLDWLARRHALRALATAAPLLWGGAPLSGCAHGRARLLALRAKARSRARRPKRTGSGAR